MAGIFDRIRGVVRVEIRAALVESLLNTCAMHGIALWDIEQHEAYCVRASVYEAQLEAFEALALKCSCEIKLVKHFGGSRNRKALARRKWLALFLLCALILLILSSFFIWEIKIIGGDNIGQGKIMRSLDLCGVKAGAFRYSFSSDLVRSKMMSMLPEIGWMAVNVNGSCATVLVTERQEKPEIYVESKGSYIVAAKTGILRELYVFNGKACALPGQSVMQGETIVSGVMESMNAAPRYVRAKALAKADTWYEISAVYPENFKYNRGKQKSYSRFSLKIGKKRINFYFRGRKDIDECVKIVHEYKMGAGGLFSLPVTVIREEIICRQKESAAADIHDDVAIRLLEQLEEAVDGEIISSSTAVSRENGLFYVSLRAHCCEDIALNIDMNSADMP